MNRTGQAELKSLARPQLCRYGMLSWKALTRRFRRHILRTRILSRKYFPCHVTWKVMLTSLGVLRTLFIYSRPVA